MPRVDLWYGMTAHFGKCNHLSWYGGMYLKHVGKLFKYSCVHSIQLGDKWSVLKLGLGETLIVQNALGENHLS